jgi:2-oxoglutarate ferredoxin oxidoreductase subunit beta
MTKGQYSPTSELGKRVKSAPMGVPDYPLHPLSVTSGVEATFVARTIGTDTKHLVTTLEPTAAHKGTAFVEVYQNCNIYNRSAALARHGEGDLEALFSSGDTWVVEN